MTLPKNGYVKLSIIILLIFVFLYAVLYFYLQNRLADEIPGQLRSLSDKCDCRIKVDRVSVNPFLRVSARGVAMTDSDPERTGILSASKVKVSPGILASILNRRIHIKDILVESPSIVVNGENLNTVNRLFGGGEKGKRASVTIDYIRLRDLRAEVGGDTSISSGRFDVLLQRDSQDRLETVSYGGSLGYRGIKSDIEGSMSIGSELIEGSVDIGINNIESRNVAGFLNKPDELSAVSEINFTIAEVIGIKGVVKIFPQPDSLISQDTLANADFNIIYERQSDRVSVDMFTYEYKDLLSGDMGGVVDEASGSRVLNLTLSARMNEASRLPDLISGLEGNDFSGALTADSLRIEGSMEKGNAGITGSVKLDNAHYENEEEKISADNLNCKLEIDQSLDPDDGFLFTSSGDCTTDSLYFYKTGDIHKISTNVNIRSEDKWSINRIGFAGISGRYSGGNAGGGVEFLFGPDGLVIGGDLNGSGLDLEKVPETLIPVNIEGVADSVNAKFEARNGVYDARLSLLVHNFVLKSNKGRSLNIGRVSSAGNIDLLYYRDRALADKPTDNTDEQVKFIIKSTGLDYEKLSFEEYHIDSGHLESLEFTMGTDNVWSARMRSRGQGFEIEGQDIKLGSFNERLSIDKSGQRGFSGTINGKGAVFKGIEFPEVSASYDYKRSSAVLKDVQAQVSTIGQFKASRVDVDMDDDTGSYPYLITFGDGSFYALDGAIRTDTVDARIDLTESGSGETDWNAKVKIASAGIVSETVSALEFNVSPDNQGVLVDDINGKLRNGDVSGKVNIITQAPETLIETDLILTNAVLGRVATGLTLGSARLYFRGRTPEGSLPGGEGKFDFFDLSHSAQGASTSLSGRLDFSTSGETLLVNNGFIRNREGAHVNFTADMENSLSESRTLTLSMPEVDLSGAIELGRPFSGALQNSKADGRASLVLVFHNLLHPDSWWLGSVSLTNASYSGFMGGNDLHMRGINGSVTLKEKRSRENPLANLMGNTLDLSKTLFQDFISGIKKTEAADSLDLLTIDEVEYGILLFENVRAELEVDRNELNLSRLTSDFFMGKLYGEGFVKFGAESSEYNVSLAFDRISLEAISRRLSSIQDYITGKVNGLIWISGDGAGLDTIDGPFKFWSKSSSDEPRRIGKALLDKLGARERLFLGSSRSYNNGDISGYIKNGLITFKVLDISNSFLGFRNLSIKVDDRMNSISISHLLSVIREIARRSQTGGPTIETN